VAELQRAMILHRRDYRDTSLIIDVLTEFDGRIHLVAKGAKRKKSTLSHALQAFQPLLISWKGKNDLMNLTYAEITEPYKKLKGSHIIWCFYVNELLYHLLSKHSACPEIFTLYQSFIKNISEKTINEEDLRYFEYDLLKELGYGFHLDKDTDKKQIQAELFYYFSSDHELIETKTDLQKKSVFTGQSIIDLSNRQLSNEKSLRDAKLILRYCLKLLLGDKNIKTRELFI
jgi:DNA repair protein RecO (recombination protein O)